MFNVDGSSEIGKVFEDENFSIHLEINSGYVYAHIDIFKKTKTTMKKLKQVFLRGLELLREEGIDYLYTYTQNPRFAKISALPNEEYVGNFTYIDGTYYEIYRWKTLKKENK